VVDTTAPLLGYSYDDVSDPLAPAGLAAPVEADMPPAEPPPVTLVGASDAPVNLGAGAATTRVAIDQPESDAALGGAPEPGRVYLNIENVRANTRATSYRVYVNAPDPETPSEDYFAGMLPLFGVREASGADDDHGGSGLTYALDITDLVARLRAKGEWTGGELEVSFLPKKPKAAAAALADDASVLQVGRVSLYYG
jgi:tyrosinase